MATTPAPVPTTPIPIRLRVVGIFYEQTFDFADITGGKTIKDLLDLAVRRGNSTPVATAGGTPVQQSVFSYATKVMHKPASKPAALFNSLLGFTHNLVAPLDPSLGNKPRKAGTYKLFESTSVENGSVTVHAWQIGRAHV